MNIRDQKGTYTRYSQGTHRELRGNSHGTHTEFIGDSQGSSQGPKSNPRGSPGCAYGIYSRDARNYPTGTIRGRIRKRRLIARKM